MPASTRHAYRYRFLFFFILITLLAGLSTPALAEVRGSAPVLEGSVEAPRTSVPGSESVLQGSVEAPLASDTSVRVGCNSLTPHEGDMCITIYDTGKISIQQHTGGGYMLLATNNEGSNLLARGTGYTFDGADGADPTPISLIRTGNTAYAVYNVGGLVVTQEVTYTEGDEWIGLKWSIFNPGSTAAADLRFIHSNYTYSPYISAITPSWNGSDTVGVTFPTGSIGSYHMELQGLTPPAAYETGSYTSVMQHTTQYALNNTLAPTNSNVYALQWNRAALAAGETWEIAAREKIVHTPITPKLTVSRYSRLAGSDGRITSTPPGIDCGPGSPNTACSAEFARDTTVQLNVTPNPGSGFFGWVKWNDTSNLVSQANPLTVTLERSQTVVAGFSQNPVDVTFTLTDGEAHPNLPLFGKLTIFSPAGQTYNFYTTDIINGQVKVSLDQGRQYTLTAESSGYRTQVRTTSYSTPTASESFALLPNAEAGCPLGYQKNAVTTPATPLDESFENGGSLPAGWQRFAYNGDVTNWSVAPEGNTGSYSAFHDIQTTSGSSNLYMDNLHSPVIHIPAGGTLTFYQKSKGLAGYYRHEVRLYELTGQQIIYQLADDFAPAQEDTWEKRSFSLSGYAGKDLAVGFYYATDQTLPAGDQWLIDDVTVSGTQGSCDGLSGGRLAGFVTGAILPELNNSVLSASVTAGGNTTAAPYGQYALWLPAGSNPVTASAAGYFPQTAAPVVVANAVTSQDFTLETGYTLDTTTTTGRGKGTVSVAQTSPYHLGQTVQVTAAPASSMHFAGWAGSGINAANRFANPLPLTITGSMAIIADFEPNPAAVTFTLTDGGGHAGTPLAGTVSVKKAGSNDSVAYPTDPFTGQATLPLDQGVSYYFTASAPGYDSQTILRSYLVSTASEAFALLPDPARGCPLGYQYNLLGTQVMFNEGFESGDFPPAGWGQSARWLASSSARTGSYAAFHDLYNSLYGSGDFLRSPRVHIPANARLTFSQKVNLRQTSYGGVHYLNVSDAADPWNGNDAYIGEVAPPAAQNTWADMTYDLSAYAGQELSIFFVHMSYSDGNNITDDQWWLDDVKLTGDTGSCTVINGGRVAGYITDSVSAGPLSGASVTGAALPTAADSKGLFQLWAPVGSTLLTASAPGHLDRSATVTVPAGAAAVTRQDFALIPLFSITTHVTGSGSIEVRVAGQLDPGPYAYGEQVTLTAIPAEHNHLVQWENGSTAPVRALTMTANLDVTAAFARDTFAITTHTVGSGSIQARVAGQLNPGPYLYNTQVTLTAVPAAHSHFLKWDDGSTSPTRVLTITGSADVTATFAADTFPITPHVLGSGVIEARVNGSLDPGPYAYGTQVTLSAIPNDYFHFVQWENAATGPTRTVTVTGSLDVTATFAVNTYSLTSHTAGTGSGSIEALVNGVANPGPYPYGTQVTLRAVPAEGSSFTRWENNATAAERTLTITGNVEVTATFSLALPDQADLAVSLGLVPTGPGSIRYTIVVTNLGPGPADGAQVTDAFGSGLGGISWTCAAQAGAACPAPSGTGDLNAAIPSLPAGGQVTFTIDAALLNGAGLENSVTVSAPGSDPNPTNNTASVQARRLYLPCLAQP